MSYSAEVLADSPQVYYRMNDASGNLADSSGNTRTGVVNGSTPFYSQTGALASDPTNNAILSNPVAPNGTYVTIAAAAWQVFSTGDFAFEFWIKTTDSGTQVVLGNSGTFWIGIVGSKLHWNGGATLDSSANINDGSYHHVVVTRRSGTVFLYIDGASDGSVSDSASIGDGTNAFAIWAFESGTFAVTATMDEVAIYSAGLTGARVSAHYAAAAGGGGSTNYLLVRN